MFRRALAAAARSARTPPSSLSPPYERDALDLPAFRPGSSENCDIGLRFLSRLIDSEELVRVPLHAMHQPADRHASHRTTSYRRGRLSALADGGAFGFKFPVET